MTDTQLQRHPDVKALILPDGYVLLHLKSYNWIYTLTPLGGLVWEFCEGANTIDDVVGSIGEIEEVTPAPDLKDKVKDLIAELEKVGLLLGDCGCGPTDWTPGERSGVVQER